MFSKKKYTRKAHNRKPFRKKTSRRRVILRPPTEVSPAPDKPAFDAVGSTLYSWIYCGMPEMPDSKVGRINSNSNSESNTFRLNTDFISDSVTDSNTDSNNNFSINDFSIVDFPINDRPITDSYSNSISNPNSSKNSNPLPTRPCSLRQIAAQVLAQNADSLCSAFLDEAPWTCWRSVWHSIVKHGRDSPYLFRIFYQSFASHTGFVCHYRKTGHFPRTHDSARSIKNAALNACLAPTLRHHRLENVFSNISVPYFASFVSGLSEAAVVVDCSGVRVFTPTQLVALCGIRNLEALDLSNTDIDDQFLYTMRASMVSKDSRLQILRIYDCPNITESGLRVLLAEPGAPRLAYIESDIQIRKTAFVDGFSASSKQAHCVPGTKWRVVPESDPAIGVVHKFHLANKLLCLSRNIPSFSAPSFIWDFKFFPQVVEGAKLTDDLVFEAWKSRLSLATSRPAHVPIMYVKDSSEAAPIQEPKPAPASMPELSVFSRAGHGVSTDKSKHSSVRKPRTVTTNAKSFFLGS